MELLLTDSDWDTFSDNSSSEQEVEEFSYVGQAQSIFSSLEESIGRIDDFLSFERIFTLGDVVCSATEPSGQMGRVVNISMCVDLENVYGKFIKGIDSKKLLTMRSVSIGDYVVLGEWVGKVGRIIDRVSIVFDDGSKTEVNVLDQEKLVPISPNLLEDSPYQYYPGQRVLVKFPQSEASGWLCGNWRGNQDEGTVCDVQTGLLYVDWVASAEKISKSDLLAPSKLQDPKHLTLLSRISDSSWQIGDWCVLPNAFHNNIEEHTFSHPGAHELLKGQKRVGIEKRDHNPNLEEIFVIMKTRAEIDLVWQDGSRSIAVDSKKLLPVGSINAHEFWPEQFVLEKDRPSSHRLGVVQTVDARENIVKVQWRPVAPYQSVGVAEDLIEETVSAYELVEHPDFAFCQNDLVFKATQSSFWVSHHSKTKKCIANGPAVACQNPLEHNDDYPETNYLSVIGIVTGLKDGSVEVRWANGSTEKVAPYHICRMEKSEGSAMNSSNDDDTQDTYQKENLCDELSSIRPDKNWILFSGIGEKNTMCAWDSTYLNFPRAAIGFFANVAASLFGFQSSVSDAGPASHDPIFEGRSESEFVADNGLQRLCSGDMNPSELCIPGDPLQMEAKGSKETLSSAFSESGSTKQKIKRFDVVRDCSDHHFRLSDTASLRSQAKRRWMKKIQHEWSILDANLPETIYVRIYEERMDLLRAVLVGAPGTPYHDGLFVFDMFLPPEFPYEPPQVHYHSGGLRLNPNLYESGKVCLSLINTWSGTESEVWNPTSSTILQVLLSLQALVLNDKPYFNEAGYDKQIGRAEGEKNSVSYNENAFLNSCKSMLYLLRKPPKHFEVLVKEHFRRRGQHILLACKAYMEGSPVGYLEDDKENSKGSSTGFKLMLFKLLPKLVEAFSETGADCLHFKPEN